MFVADVLMSHSKWAHQTGPHNKAKSLSNRKRNLKGTQEKLGITAGWSKPQRFFAPAQALSLHPRGWEFFHTEECRTHGRGASLLFLALVLVILSGSLMCWRKRCFRFCLWVSWKHPQPLQQNHFSGNGWKRPQNKPWKALLGSSKLDFTEKWTQPLVFWSCFAWFHKEKIYQCIKQDRLYTLVQYQPNKPNRTKPSQTKPNHFPHLHLPPQPISPEALKLSWLVLVFTWAWRVENRVVSLVFEGSKRVRGDQFSLV